MTKAEHPGAQVGYECGGHGFFNRGKSCSATLTETNRFLDGLGWIM